MDALAPAALSNDVQGASRAAARRLRSRLPNLVVIGAMKAGTTSLHHYLALHPEIAMSTVKEPDFFVRELGWKRGLGWYAGLFAPSAVRGESSTSYTKAPRYAGVAARMHALVPDARLVYVVRDPIARIVSHYVHEYAGGREHRPIEAALAPEAARGSQYVDVSRYAMQLEQYLGVYGEDRILVVESETLRERRRETLSRIFSFLCVDSRFWCSDYDHELGRTDQRVRLSPSAYALLRLSAPIPRGLRSALPSWARPVRSFAARSARPIPRPELDEHARDGLAELLSDDAERLRKLTGQRFEGWQV